MPGKRKISDNQWKILLTFMEHHPDIANAKPVNVYLRQQLTEAWDELAMRLNADSHGGSVKTPRQWREYWNDKKYHVNRKRIIARQQRRALISNQSPTQKMIFFTESEARMIKILTPKNGQTKQNVLKDEITTSVVNPSMIQETEDGIVFIPYDEGHSDSASTSALMAENVKMEIANSPEPGLSSEACSSPRNSPSPPQIFTTGTPINKSTLRNGRLKRTHNPSVPTMEEIRRAAEDRILAKQERRLAAKERRMATEERRIAAEDRKLAAEDRLLAIEERKRAVHERKLAEEARRKTTENKMTRALHNMSQKLNRLREEFDARPP